MLKNNLNSFINGKTIYENVIKETKKELDNIS